MLLHGDHGGSWLTMVNHGFAHVLLNGTIVLAMVRFSLGWGDIHVSSHIRVVADVESSFQCDEDVIVM